MTASCINAQTQGRNRSMYADCIFKILYTANTAGCWLGQHKASWPLDQRAVNNLANAN